MKKIVFINQWPSHLTKDIINVFAEEFDEVSLIAGRISESGNTLNKKVRISHIIKYNKKNTFSRQITWIIAAIQTFFLVIFKFRGHHLFLTSNPPILTFLPIFCRHKYSVQILDIYPDALVGGGFISENSWFIRFWMKQNKKYFARALNVFTITGGMAQTISRYCDPDKIKVIPQWPSSNGHNKIDRSCNEFIRTHSLENYFIIMYSGNLGIGHHVPVLIESARLLQDFEDIKFVIIGEGFNKPVIERLIKDYNLNNCLVLPFQSSEMFKHSSQAADIGVVSVSKELAMLSVPIKTYNIINNNVPLLGITEKESELARLISEYDIGKYFSSTQVQEISDFIVTLKSNNEINEKYKGNLRKCSRIFSSENASLYLTDFVF